MNFVLGSTGRLGQAIAASYPTGQIVALERGTYAEWGGSEGSVRAARYFQRWASTGSVIFVAAGLIDPARPRAEHEIVNLQLPRSIIEGAAQHGLRVVTFGTVMENIVRADSPNPYFRSKVALGRFVTEHGGGSVLHLRMHTLFGGRRPDAFMFLGQIFDAIGSRSPFRMSSGRQLREYHHIDDEVVAIRRLVASGISGTFDLNHGDPLRLRDLATHLFDAFGCPELLHVGSLPDPVDDNYGVVYERGAQLRDVAFRDTRSGVVQYMRACGIADERVR